MKQNTLISVARAVAWLAFGGALVVIHIIAGGSPLAILLFMFCTYFIGELAALAWTVMRLIEILRDERNDNRLNLLSKYAGSKADGPPNNGNKSPE